MIRLIIRKELLVNIHSLRFIIGLAVTATLVGLIGYILAEDYSFRYQNYISNVENSQKDLQQTRVYSMLNVTIDIPPSPLSVFSRGSIATPIAIKVDHTAIPCLVDQPEGSSSISLGVSSNRPYNPLLRFFTAVDLTFVIGMVLSLFSVLLVFDSFSGEKEQGTLRLLLSTSVGWVQVYVGKFLGAIITMAIPLTVGFIILALIWTFHPGMSLSGSDWSGVICIYILSLFFLAGVIALGLLVSLYSKDSSSGLMYLLFLWVILTIVIPEGVGYLARPLYPRASAEDMTKDISVQYHNALNKIQYEGGHSWMSRFYGATRISITGMSKAYAQRIFEYMSKAFPLALQYADHRYRVLEQYAQRIHRWKSLRDGLAGCSIYELYRNCVTAIAGTDVETLENAYDYARQYQLMLVEYARPKIATMRWFTRLEDYPEFEATPEREVQWKGRMDKEGFSAIYQIFDENKIAPLDLHDLSLPNYDFADWLGRLRAVSLDVALMVLMTSVFLFFGYRKVMKYAIV